MRGKKTDIKTKAKIIKEKINTFGSARDIEQSTGIPHETVAKVLRDDFAQVCTESKAAANLIDVNNNLISLADKRLQELLVDPDKEIKPNDLVSIRESAFKQNQLLGGKPTENETITIKWDTGNEKT